MHYLQEVDAKQKSIKSKADNLILLSLYFYSVQAYMRFMFGPMSPSQGSLKLEFWSGFCNGGGLMSETHESLNVDTIAC